MPRIYLTVDKAPTLKDIELIRVLLEMKLIDGLKIGLAAFFTKDLSGKTVADNLIQITRRYRALWIADSKFLDIPHQVGAATLGLILQQPNGYTAHANGKIEMLKASLLARDEAFNAYRVADTQWSKPPLFVVTTLSSIGDSSEMLQLLREINDSGAEGVVCTSKALLQAVRKWHPHLLTLVTSVRATWACWIKNDDQKQSISPEEIRTLQPTNVVLGRIVWHSPNPVDTARRIAFTFRP